MAAWHGLGGRSFGVRAAALAASAEPALLGRGYCLGQRQRAQALKGAAFLAQAAELNDARVMLAH